MEKDFTYPVTPKTLHKYAESIFAPIRRGECVTTVWVPMAGRRMWNKFIIENIHLFEKELPHYDKYLLVYVEPLDLTEESLAGYLRLMAKSFIYVCSTHKEGRQNLNSEDVAVFDLPNVTYSKLLEALRLMLRRVTDSGLEVVFFVGEFDELGFANTIFYNNLKSLWSQLYPRLQYVFLMREYVVSDNNLNKWGDFNEAILQNIIYIPILNDEDFSYVLERLSKQFVVSVSDDQAEVLRRLTGGHPYLMKVGLRLLKSGNGGNRTFEEALFDHYEIRSVARGMLEVLSDRQLELLKRINGGEVVQELSGGQEKSLSQLRIIKKDAQSHYQIFGELVSQAVKRLSNRDNEHTEQYNTLQVEKLFGTVMLGGRAIEEKFTPQEYSILVMLLNNTDKVSNRNDIGDVLWGKEAYEKYSDWAIDQLMSKLRRKLSDLGVKDKLVTIRGKGYKIVRANI